MSRTFTELQHTKTTRELNRICMDVSKKYANATGHISKRMLCEEYNIAPSCCTRVLDIAVVHCLISEPEIVRMQDRAVKNAQANSNCSGFAVEMHYEKLWKARKDFIKKLVEDYATTETSLQELLDKYGRDRKGFFYMINQALKESKKFDITFNLAKQVQIRMLSDCTSTEECARVTAYFSRIW